MWKSAALSLLLVGFASCVVLRGWDEAPATWSMVSRAEAEREFVFRIALKQRNLDKLEKALYDVSDPDSPNWGKHWTKEQILELISPPARDVKKVTDWLASKGIQNVENHGDMLKVTAQVYQVEELFGGMIFKFRGESSLAVARLIGQFTVPDQVHEVVELFSSLYDFPKAPKANKRRPVNSRGPTNDGINVYPQLLQYLYKVPSNFKGNKGSSLCLSEFQNTNFPSSFSYSDLQQFYSSSIMNMKYNNVSVLVGPYNPPDNLAEATLDVEYGSAVALDTTVWYWTVAGWMYDFASELFNRPKVPGVVSMSWGWPEPWECSNGTGTCPGGVTAPVYVQRVNGEFKKAGLRGVSLVAASGDQGAPGDENPSCANPAKPLSDIYPGGSPYVLSIGATMLLNPGSGSGSVNEPPACQQTTCANTPLVETTCSIPTALITSGGGFSSYDGMPSWQAAYVAKYLTSKVPLPPKKYFNASARAFPDVSALGHGYLIQWNGGLQQVDGTSASTPVWGALISLFNAGRLNNKKQLLGWLGPVIYKAYAADPTMFNDITTGNNLCTEFCCTTNYGYYAAKGWDPATGLGTPNFAKLYNYFVNTLP